MSARNRLLRRGTAESCWTRLSKSTLLALLKGAAAPVCKEMRDLGSLLLSHSAGQKRGCQSLVKVRTVSADTQKVNGWLGGEAGKPVHVGIDSTDLPTELRQGLSFAREAHRRKI
jgi:hypothetical protein